MSAVVPPAKSQFDEFWKMMPSRVSQVPSRFADWASAAGAIASMARQTRYGRQRKICAFMEHAPVFANWNSARLPPPCRDRSCPFGHVAHGQPSEQLVEEVIHLVHELVNGASPLPALELDLAAVGGVALKDRVEPLRSPGIDEGHRDLVVGLEGAVVEVGRPHRAP